MADQPLVGRRIVVTRPEAQRLADQLERLGAEVTLVPLIEIRPAEDRHALEDAVGRMSTYDWIVLTSVNGVAAVHVGLVGLVGTKVAAVGPVTAEAIRERGVEPAFVAARASDDISAGLGDITGLRILMPQADIAEPHLAAELRGKGAEVDVVIAYRTVLVEPPMWGILPLRIADAVVLASGSACRSLAAAGGAGDGVVLVCIGPKTAKVAREVGLKVGLVADETTADGIIQALVSHFGESSMTSYRSEPLEALRLGPGAKRPRRLRRTAALRELVRETSLDPADLVYPLFVVTGEGVRNPVTSMPGIDQLSVDALAAEARALTALGVKAVLLFGIPGSKDAQGLESFAEDGVVQQAIGALKSASPELVVLTDVCLCEYTDHGHCGLLDEDGYVLNDETLDVFGRIAVSHAEAGADVVAPSGMLDGMVGAIRSALDAEGFQGVAILSYAVKYASALYAPFREAAEGAPAFGDRRTHQMDPANAREALREVALDVEQGADALLVKPALGYLDVVHAVRDQFGELPLAAFNVSGEYAMVKAAAANGWLDERAAVLELLTGIRRAGADIVITYHAKDAAAWLQTGR